MGYVALIFSFLIFTSLAFGARPLAHKLELPGPIAKNVDGVIRNTLNLHLALFAGNDSGIHDKIETLLFSIEKARKAASLNSTNEAHLKRILTTAEKQLIQVRTAEGKVRQDHLREVFRQLVLVVQSFHVQQTLIFYCGKDNTIWLQSAPKPQHPLHPTENCGSRVN
jgi:hypothetical protein